LKIYIHTYDERYKDRIAFIDKIKENLEKIGINFVDNHEACDIVLTQQVAYSPSLEFPLSLKKDVIILEVNDTACIFNDEIRNSLKSDHVKGIFKVTNFFDLDNHNIDSPGERIHTGLLNGSEEYFIKQHTVRFNDKELLKIKCALPTFLNFRMDSVRSVNIDLENDKLKNRNITFNFAGTTNYKKNKNYVALKEDDPKLALPKLIAHHRNTMINELVNNYKVEENEKYILTNEKPMSQPTYWNSLLKTKACLSPWGFGAYNWRDYEAIYTGAILIKPNTDFLETYCNLFNSGINYVSCDYNFKDLVEKINYVKNDQNKELIQNIRINALNLLKKESNLDRIAKRFKRQLIELLEK
jgi:hypothetical protein